MSSSTFNWVRFWHAINTFTYSIISQYFVHGLMLSFWLSSCSILEMRNESLLSTDSLPHLTDYFSSPNCCIIIAKQHLHASVHVAKSRCLCGPWHYNDMFLLILKQNADQIFHRSFWSSVNFPVCRKYFLAVHFYTTNITYCTIT